MSEVWQCFVDSDCEVRGESWAAVLGVFGVSEVPNDAKPLTCGLHIEPARAQKPESDKHFIERENNEVRNPV